MFSTANETITRLTILSRRINIYFASPILILGTIGNLINILVFSRRSFRKCPCSIYFRWASIMSLLALYSGLISRLLSGYYLDLTTSNNILCKLRFYFYYGSVSLLSWFLVFASFDRYLITSRIVHQRNISRPSIAHRLILYTAIISILFYIQVFFCFVSDRNQFPIQCYSKGNICRTFNDMQFLIVYSFLPAILMAIFGCLTVNNVRQMGRQIESLMNIRMASANNNKNSILHVGYIVPLYDMFDNEQLQTLFTNQNITFRSNVYSAMLFFRDKDQTTLSSWYDQRKNTVKQGYLRALYKRKDDVVLEMDVDGKSFYLIATHCSQPPVAIKKEVNSGAYGAKIECDRIQLPCFPYKCDQVNGFVQSDKLTQYKEEQTKKRTT
ncbi:unnamed protein product [Adineta steineri]|uniref:G-protein coupled receptors family 1 profile domain-containing protein n=2 Tax=Adineta steineri TaxID=433720 RepID=A0A819H778_9BILA|nr:unnamed protein product [Adineta steineri]